MGKAALLSGVAFVVATWFRRHGDDVVDEPAPGNAQWPPLRPLIPEPSDGAPAEPVAAVPVDENRRWTEPLPDGDCPDGYPVKAKNRSGIYHVPGGLAYDRTNADRCYITAADAEADGYRASKA